MADAIYMLLGNKVACLVKGGWRIVDLTSREDILIEATEADLAFLGFVPTDERTIGTMSGLNTRDVPTLFSHGFLEPQLVKEDALNHKGMDEEEADVDHSWV